MAAVSNSINLLASGCPGSQLSLSLTGLVMQLHRPVSWAVTSTSAVDPQLGALQVDADSSKDVPFTITYEAEVLPAVRQLTGQVVVANVGSKVALLQQMFVEVLPLGAEGVGEPPLVAAVSCPSNGQAAGAMTGSTSSSAGAAEEPSMLLVTRVPVGAHLQCSFAVDVPGGLQGHAAVRAQGLLSDTSSITSPPTTFDLSQQLQQVQADALPGPCAMVSDSFVGGRGRVVPLQSSRPASAAASVKICSSQTVSFVARVGPFGQDVCGQKLWVSAWAQYCRDRNHHKGFGGAR